MANANVLQHKAPEFPRCFGVVTAGSPPYLHAMFDTWAEAARYIMEHGMRAVAWIQQI